MKRIKSYINKKKKFTNLFLSLLDEKDDETDDIQKLNTFINEKDILNNKHELQEVLHIISQIIKDHHRTPNFFDQIETFFQNIKYNIIQNFDNSEIFKIFKKNKLFLLFLFEKEIILLDESIIHQILKMPNHNRICYYFFFYKEIIPFITQENKDKIENEMLSINQQVFENFEEKRSKGENDSYICYLIRNDLINEFVQYVNKNVISLSSRINPSIFETNSFLLKNRPTLIEYASFFGSIQIFQFLLLNNVELSRSLWLYAIHGNNPEIIHLLEENHVEPEDETYEKCLKESIKCHHNDIAYYIENNLIIRNSENISNIVFQTLKFKKALNITESNKRYKDDTVKIKFIQNNKFDYFDDQSYILYAFYYANRYNNQDIVELFLLNPEIILHKNFYSKQESLTKINVSSSITEIGNSAFKYCPNLTEVTLPASVKRIGKNTFKKCNELRKVTILSPITVICSKSFFCCPSLTEVSIPNSVTSIENCAFYGCSSLTKINISNSLESIGINSFSKCFSLQQIALPSSLKSIGFEAFLECKSLTSISIPDSLTSIGAGAFMKCKSLTEILLPSSLTFIERYVFNSCTSLNTITIPHSVTFLDEASFCGCLSLTKVSFTKDSKLNSIGNAVFKQCSSLIDIQLPLSLNSIGPLAFNRCSSLQKIIIPSSVRFIHENAFFCMASLKQLSIPSSVKIIGHGAFGECPSLEKIAIPYFVSDAKHYLTFIGITSNVIVEKNPKIVKK